MKITDINIPSSLSGKYGLSEIKMNRLNEVVIIAGKNGAGKTRFFNLLKDVTRSDKLDELARWNQFLHNAMAELKATKAAFSILESDDEMFPTYKSLEIEHQQKVDSFRATIDKNTFLTLSKTSFNYKVIDFVPKQTALTDSYLMSGQDIDVAAQQIYDPGIRRISEAVIPAITNIQKQWVNASVMSSDLSLTEQEILIINDAYKKLQNYIKKFLGTDLKRDKNGNPVIFDSRIGEAKLSDGQIILLQFCLALYGQENSLDELIILMDEPENHLHPAALIEVIDNIIPNVKNGQIWIATHCINVIAHFDPSTIFYVNEGDISFAGNIPQTVLNGLLGTEEEIERLTNFLSLPAKMANNQYAFESLFYPKVVFTGLKDPQITQIHTIIKELIDKSEKIKVLDFGMGKGRLLATIYENDRIKGIDSCSWLDYYGYDIDSSYKEICQNLLSQVYGSYEGRYLNLSKQLLASYQPDSFDVIVMCNVFHEIDPAAWTTLFNSPTNVFQLLKNDSYLLIVEDQLLAIGEKAHAKGFLVFDILEFQALFNTNKEKGYFCSDYYGDGRLKAHHIPKACINLVSADSKKKSIEILFQNSKDEIKKLRTKEVNFRNGRQHAFWAQQLANSSLVIDELK